MNRLIVHIGRHKTATSSVQQFFRRNRWILRRFGVVYPDAYDAQGQSLPKLFTISSPPFVTGLRMGVNHIPYSARRRP